MSEPTRTITAGGALLARLKAVGVDYIFAILHGVEGRCLGI